MAELTLSREDAQQEVADMVKEGYRSVYIRQQMAERGFSYPEINSMMAKVSGGEVVYGKPKVRQSTASGKRYYSHQPTYASSGLSDKAFIGLIIMVIGIAVTFFSYQSAASSPTGGSYVVAWGAIIFGGLQFLRGLGGE